MLNSKALAASASAAKVYVEDVFSTWLYTGNDSTQTIANGIDLSGKGGLVWIKCRSIANSHNLWDTARGATKYLGTNFASGQATMAQGVSSFGSSGFTLGNDNYVNASSGAGGGTYASWTFREQAKFFDVVTWTGNGAASRAISHNLGSQPGFVVCKRTDSTSAWPCAHRSGYYGMSLNTTDAGAGWADYNTYITSTTFDPTQLSGGFNTNGATYVAYLFAHDAGGFGDGGNDSVVSCGSYTGNGSTSGPTVTLGWEPQWLLIKRSNGFGEWVLLDSMRGIANGSTDARLFANDSTAEGSQDLISLLPTGFQLATTNNVVNGSSETYIYIAIRRGPMKTPTDATKVFAALATSSGSTGTSRTVGFPADFAFARWRSGTTAMQAVDRLRGMPTSSNANALLTSSTAAEAGTSPYMYDVWNTTAKDGSNANGNDMVWQYFRRAPGYFDAVCYTGTGSARTVSHNLGVVPELMIVKSRSATQNWWVWHSAFVTAGSTDGILLNSDLNKGYYTQDTWNGTVPTSSAFSLGVSADTNNSGWTFVAYLFATCPGVSKVGSYTGSGTTKQIDCGFTNGARFVLIKRTDSTGDWYVWDTARGIIAANDPYLLLNSTAAEVTNTDYIDPLNSGFEISSTAPAAINANGGSFIFLAVA